MDRQFLGAGLGLRRTLINEMKQHKVILDDMVDFLEVAPENWMQLDGNLKKQFEYFSNSYTMVAHGLSLSIGSCDPLDIDFLLHLKQFFKEFNIQAYSEHLSACSYDGHMYDLMPVPFTREGVNYISERINIVQDILECPLILENVSFYTPIDCQMSELEFYLSVIDKSNCQILLDVNNVYVNSVNHKYDAKAFIESLPSDKIVYGHIAGHSNRENDLIIDTHASGVIEPVWELLEHAYQLHGVFPTLLERDFNFNGLAPLLDEVNRIKRIQTSYS